MIEVKAPATYNDYLNKPSVFLAGSIEMGVAEDWQAKVSAALAPLDVLVLNPRRSNWDSSWAQTIDNPPFREQVEWELDALDAADVVLMYDQPSKLAAAVHISRRTLRIVHQNIVFAIGVKLVILVLSALGYADMWAAVFADVGVTILAILNAMRALRIKES